MTPGGTPREALYIETGLLDIESIANEKRLNMKARLNRDKSELMAKILSNPQCMWEKDTNEAISNANLQKEDLNGSKAQVKNLVKRAIMNKFKEKVELDCQNKSKMTYFLEGKMGWIPGKRAEYMNELTRKQTSLIFKARTRMIKVKGNYKNGHPDLTCRMCGEREESQVHILEECPEMHKDNAIKVPKHQLFNENTSTLRQVANNLEIILEKLGDEAYC